MRGRVLAAVGLILACDGSSRRELLRPYEAGVDAATREVGLADAEIDGSTGGRAGESMGSGTGSSMGRSVAPDNAMELLEGQFAAPDGRPRAPADTIAYVTRSGAISGLSQIRLIQADGTGDRLLFEVDPEEVSEFYRPGDLVWSPDGTELAFTSGHLDASFYVRDVYAVTVDGKNLRRITNPPLPDRLQAYPSGIVELEAHTFEGISSTWWAYIEGAPKAIRWENTDRWERWDLTFDAVADFGNRDQYAVVRDLHSAAGTLPYCSYGRNGRVDVEPGESVRVPSALPESGRSSQPCVYADKPQWSGDGLQMMYLVPNNQVVYPAYEVWSVPAVNGNPGERGRRIGALANQGATVTQLLVDPANDQRFALMIEGPGGGFQRIFLVSTADPSKATEIPKTALCAPDAIWDCAYPMLAWQADGQGFYYATWAPNSVDPAVREACGEIRPCNELRRFDLNRMTFESVAVFPGKQLGSMSLAPDGERLVMEVDTEVTAVQDLWIHELSSRQSRLLVRGAALGAWVRGS